MKTIPFQSHSFNEWLHYLELQSPSDKIDLGLERIKAVAKKLDLLNPDYFLFTVAGTNGKGTTCRALECFLLADNHQVGVFSSPHLIHYKERVRINDKSPTDAEFVAAFNHIAKHQEETDLTYFEYTTLAALYLFKQAHLQVVILEVGLGGRLDATNILNADIAIITTIDIDHTAFLGSTREAIGYEKAGIFKANSQQIAIVGDQNMPFSIKEQAEIKHIPLHCPKPNLDADWEFTEMNSETWELKIGLKNKDPKSYSNLPIPQLPIQNAATALVAFYYSPFKIKETTIKRTLTQMSLIGRLQKLENVPDLIVDVAHNPHSARYLKQQILKRIEQHKYSALHIIIGMLKDKEIEKTIEALDFDLLPVDWNCVTLSGKRGADSKTIASMIKKQTKQIDSSIQCFDSVCEALQHVKQQVHPHDLILICGSFQTVSEVFLCLN